VTTYDERGNLSDLTATVERIQNAVEQVIEGKPEAVRLSLTVLLAEGHLLMEDVPGVGKTMLAKALARSVDCAASSSRRTCCRRTSPASPYGTSSGGTSSSSRARSSRRW
jgi:MoxR-like ATPase